MAGRQQMEVWTMATDKFMYDTYAELVETSKGDVWTVWCTDVKLRSTGELVHRTVQYNSMIDSLDAALDWIDDNVDNEDM
jgi:hypothetical protein